MSLSETIRKDMFEASKAGEKDRVDILKLAMASIKNEEIAQGRQLSDEDIIKVLRKEESKIKDSIMQFTKMGRSDLVDRERKQLEIISSYLPALMSEEEIEKVVSRVILDIHAQGVQSVGAVMSSVMKELNGKADGSTVKGVVQKLLSK